MNFASIDQALDTAFALHQSGRLKEAEAIYRQVLTQQSNHADALHLLGMLAHQVGRHEAAAELIERAISVNPQVAGYSSNLGLVRIALGRYEEAAVACRRALELQPEYPEALNNLGIALRRSGQVDAAIGAYQQAIDLRPDYPEARNNLASALAERGRADDAIALCQRTLAMHPQNAESHCILGVLLGETGQLDEGISACRRALALRPDYPEALNNIGRLLKETGRIEQAVNAYRRAVQVAPGMAALWSNFLYYLYFDPRYDVRQIYEEHRRYNQMIAAPLERLVRPHGNDHSLDRRLRVGYVSPDFRNHCTSFFTVPLLSAHDPAQVEVFCYADVARPDAVTERLKGYAHVWRNIVGLTDEQVAQQIADDRIDILVDLTLHMLNGRPLMFARKPAPVQVSWLGYPGTSGLTTMDYRFTDPHLDPPGENDQWHFEKAARLPETMWCYDPMSTVPTVNALPAADGKPITFACLNTFSKVNDALLELWARVLRTAENSRMLIVAPEGDSRQRVLAKMKAAGVDPARIEFIDRRPWLQYMELYHRIDIALDTFPWNGHTTSIEGLWMGVPVVTLCGQTPVSRGGLCFLSNLGLADLVANTPGQYVEIAVQLAGDLPGLSEIRRTLRARMESSPLMDRARFARHVEAAYRAMWRDWCKK